MPETELTDEQVNKLRIEYVFGLTGGELHEPHPDFPDQWDKLFEYWYEGMPDWAGTPDPQAVCNDPEAEFRTGIGFYDPPEKELELWFLEPESPRYEYWDLYETYRTSGETACPWDGDGAEDELETARKERVERRERGLSVPADEENRCPLCEDDGYIYIGDGWYEAVYLKRR